MVLDFLIGATFGIVMITGFVATVFCWFKAVCSKDEAAKKRWVPNESVHVG